MILNKHTTKGSVIQSVLLVVNVYPLILFLFGKRCEKQQTFDKVKTAILFFRFDLIIKFSDSSMIKIVINSLSVK